jgi:CRISPR-associated protein Cas8a1/Csx13
MEVIIDIDEPGMTPLLKAGVGGLACSLRAYALENGSKENNWAQNINICGGVFTVQPRKIKISFEDENLMESVWKELFGFSFQIKSGFVYFPGSYNKDIPSYVLSAFQDALLYTFLQHGRCRDLANKTTTETLIDEEIRRYQCRRIKDYRHKNAFDLVLKSFKEGSAELAGWAYPGTAHINAALLGTKCKYFPTNVISAIFSIIGCLSFIASGNKGCLIILEPTNLILFAKYRNKFTPKELKKVYVFGSSDAIIQTKLDIKVSEINGREKSGVGNIHSVLFKSEKWSDKQKTRFYSKTFETDDFDHDFYEEILSEFPNKIINKKAKEDESSFFCSINKFKDFIATNVIEERKWFFGFCEYFKSIGKSKDVRRFISNQKKGIIKMAEYFTDEEDSIVKTIHEAMRCRFGQIAGKTQNKNSMYNRMDKERDRIIRSFSSSKTESQFRAEVCDLLSKAGGGKILRDNWKTSWLLINNDWHKAKDLALLACVTYKSENENIQEVQEIQEIKGE